jgi:4'-phosphopantetheinyl transferase
MNDCIDPFEARSAGPPVLAPGEIHVWQLDLAGEPPADAHAHLQPSERTRAQRFAFDRDRNRYIHARLGLRRLLALYMDSRPREVKIDLDANGKPFVDAIPGFGFNLSHAGDLGIAAFGLPRSIGIDIEEMVPPPGMRELAASLFTARELASLAAVPDQSLGRPFLTCWTRKEAYLKALGLGLGREPNSVDVGTEPGRRHVPVAAVSGEEFVEIVTVLSNERCVAALGVRGGFERIRLMRSADWPVAGPRRIAGRKRQ